MSKLVSIAIPVYNAEAYLRDAIQSVINQTYKDWILYLINDGSTDGSLSIMQEFVIRDSRITIVDDGQNKGLIARLNQSTAMTKSKYYARMDADDIMYITRIEEQVKFLESYPEVDVVGTSIMTIDNNNNIVGSGLSTGKVKGFIHPTIMGKTEWFQTNPYSSWALRAEDAELWCRTSSKSNFYAISKPLFFYREFGVPTFRKYYLSEKTLLKIYSHYIDYGKSFDWFFKNYMIVLCKIVVYSLFALIGLTDLLIKRRRRIPVSANECLTEEDLLKSIDRGNRL